MKLEASVCRKWLFEASACRKHEFSFRDFVLRGNGTASRLVHEQISISQFLVEAMALTTIAALISLIICVVLIRMVCAARAKLVADYQYPGGFEGS